MAGAERAPHAARHEVQTTVFSWPELNSGDCHQIDGRLAISSDGSAVFTVTTWTDHTHSGDVWHTQFQLLDHTQTPLVTSPNFDSPRMDDGNPSPRYEWAKSFQYNAELYPAVEAVMQWYSC